METADSTPRRAVDDLIAGLTQTIAELREERDALRALAHAVGDDAATLRLIYRQALGALHDLFERERRQQARYRALLDDMRSLRPQESERAA